MIDFRPPHHITTQEEWDFIFKTQIENCAKLKNTEAQYYSCIDSTGKITRKVVIEFDDEPEDPMINWKQKMEQYCNEKWEIRLLREGATSSTTAMGIMSLKKRYKKIMGIND